MYEIEGPRLVPLHRCPARANRFRQLGDERAFVTLSRCETLVEVAFALRVSRSLTEEFVLPRKPPRKGNRLGSSTYFPCQQGVHKTVVVIHQTTTLSTVRPLFVHRMSTFDFRAG